MTQMKEEDHSRGHESLAEQRQTSHSYAVGVKQVKHDSMPIPGIPSSGSAHFITSCSSNDLL